jgi:hypothetical protein
MRTAARIENAWFHRPEKNIRRRIGKHWWPSVDQSDLNSLGVGIREIERDRFREPDWRLGIGKPFGVLRDYRLHVLG